jgi:hypothetical protein
MNPCIIITSHLNNERKREVCEKLIDYLKEFNLPIIHLGNYTIPENLQSKTDYTIFMKDNPKVNRTINVWRSIPNSAGIGSNLKGWTIVPDHGYAHMLSHYRAILFANSIGYDYVYAINYDVKISKDNFLDMIKNSQNYKPVCFIDRNIKPDIGMSFNLFSISTNDYIKAYKEKLMLYKNNNPPLPSDWYPESFNRWVWDSFGLTDRAHTNINFEHTESNFTTKGSFGECLPYYFNKTNKIVLLFTEKQEKTPKIKVNDNEIEVRKLDDNFFEIENISGEHYIKNKYGDYELRFNNDKNFSKYNYIK